MKDLLLLLQKEKSKLSSTALDDTKLKSDTETKASEEGSKTAQTNNTENKPQSDGFFLKIHLQLSPEELKEARELAQTHYHQRSKRVPLGLGAMYKN